MHKHFTLQPLMNLAQQQNDAAIRNLGQLNRQQQDAQLKLEALLEYRKEYQAQWQKITQVGINPSDLRNFHQFIANLDEAISRQLKEVEQSKASTQTGRSEFETTLQKLKSLDTLHQRHIQKQKSIIAKSEQKTLDEHTGRLAACKTINAEDQHE